MGPILRQAGGTRAGMEERGAESGMRPKSNSRGPRGSPTLGAGMGEDTAVIPGLRGKVSF